MRQDIDINIIGLTGNKMLNKENTLEFALY